MVGKISRKLSLITSSLFSGGCIPIAPDGFWKYRRNPTKSLNATASLFNELGGETIIEVGTGLHGKGSGNSMLVWTQKTRAKYIVALDLEQERLNEVEKGTTEHSSRVELVLEDGIEYLKRFSKSIDLLYLDFWTPDPEGSIEGTGRAEAYKQAYLAAKDKLSARSLILIDDTDHVHPWKHTLIIPLAREDGYQVIHSGRQTLMKKG